MRTDCTIDGRAIPCPNAMFMGSNRGSAKPGDCILYKEYRGTDGAYGTRLARVLGRVSAPELSFAKPVKGYALAMALSDDATDGYERWIDPADIVQVFD